MSYVVAWGHAVLQRGGEAGAQGHADDGGDGVGA